MVTYAGTFSFSGQIGDPVFGPLFQLDTSGTITADLQQSEPGSISRLEGTWQPATFTIHEVELDTPPYPNQGLTYFASGTISAIYDYVALPSPFDTNYGQWWDGNTVTEIVFQGNDSPDNFTGTISITSGGWAGTGDIPITFTTTTPPPPFLSIVDSKPVVEGTVGPLFASFRVSLSAASQDTITVDYTTNDGTAKAGTDYTAENGTLTFSPGQTTATIQVPVTQEKFAEHFREFTVQLSNPVDEGSGQAPALENNVGIGLIEMPDAKCIYDFNGDGKSTGNEIRVSDAKATIDNAKAQIDLINFELKGASAHLDNLVQNKSDADVRLNAAQIKANVELAGDALTLFEVGVGVKLAVHAVNIVTAATLGNPDEVPATALDQVEGAIWDAALAPLPYLGVLDQAKTVKDAFSVISRVPNPTSDEITAARNSVSIFQKLIADTQRKIDQLNADKAHWEKVVAAAAKCVQDVTPAQIEAMTVETNAGNVGLATNPSAPNVFPTTAASLSSGLSVAQGTIGNDTIHATANDLGGTSSVCFIAPGIGNDNVLVSAGAVYIQNQGGTDTVSVLDPLTGQAASINDILLQGADPSTPGGVALGVGDHLFLATQGVQRFLFGDGILLATGTFDVTTPAAAGTGPIMFLTGASATLQIENTALTNGVFANPITDFALTDKIDLHGLKFVNGATATYDPNTHLLTVKSGNVTDTLTLMTPDPGTFQAASDGHGGTQVTLHSPLTVTSVDTPAPSGEVGLGQTIHFTLNMSEGVVVDTTGGAPFLALNNWATASYDASASDLATGKLVFDYTVGATDAIPDLSVLAVNLPTGTTVQDANGIGANFATLPLQSTGLQVGPPVVAFVSPSQTGDVDTGQTVQLTLTLSQGVIADISGGLPTLALSDGATATYDANASDPTGGTLVFDYTVGQGETVTDLEVTQVNLNGATVQDSHGVDVDFANALSFPTGLSVNSPLTVAAVTSSQSGTVSSGTLKLTLTMSNAVVVDTSTGVPSLELNDGATAVYDANASDPSAGKLVFDYTIQAGEKTPNLAISAANLFGTVQDAPGNNADFAGALNVGLGVQIDAIPGVTAITASGAGITNGNGDLNVGKTVALTVDFSFPVTVVGKPTLSLSDGGVATYLAGSGTNALTFSYKVAAGHNSSDLAVTAFNLNGATVKDAFGNNADLSGATNVNPAGTLQIDTIAPTVTQMVGTPSSGVLAAGQTVTIDLTTSEAVAVTGAPTLKLNDKGIAIYNAANSDPANGKLEFDYLTKVGQNTADLKVSALTLAKGASIKDLAGNTLIPSGAANADLHVVVDTVAPTVKTVTVSPPSGALLNGNSLTITLVMSEAVTVSNNPALTLSDGSTAAYVSGSGTNTLVFKYNVGSESTVDLKITGIDQSGGSITDLAGNPLAATLAFDSKLQVNVFNWAHATSGDWNTGSNWLQGAVPGSGSTALLTTAGTYTVTSAQGNSVSVLDTASGATLAIVAGLFDMLGGTGAGANAGHITVADAASLGIGGLFNNTGTVAVDTPAGSDDTSLMVTGATSLAGKGHLNLLNDHASIVSDGQAVTLTNLGNTISGVGLIGGDDLLSFVNSSGTIAANVANDAHGLVIDTFNFNNAGILEATNQGVLVIDSDITNTSKGILEALTAGSHIDLNDVTISGGTVSTVKGSLIESVGGTSTISGAIVKNAGTLGAEGGDLIVTGAVTNTGILDANNHQLTVQGAVTGKGTATIEGSGILEFGAASSAKVAFAPGAAGTFMLDEATNSTFKFTGTITDFAANDHIDLGAIDYTTGDPQLSYLAKSATTGVLTVTDGTHSESLAFNGSYQQADFHVTNDGHGHVDLWFV